MRVALVSCLLFTCLSAFAQNPDLERDVASAESKKSSERTITSQAYTPDAGRFLLGVSLSPSYINREVKSNNVKTGEIEISSGSFNLTFAAGITNEFFAALSIGSNSTTTEAKPVTGATSTYKSSGARSPVVALGYSFGKASDMPIIAMVVYSPKNGKAKEATTTHDGNSLSSADATALSGHAIVTRGILESDIGIVYRLKANGVSEDATTGAETTTETPSVLGLSYSGQVEAMDSLYFVAGADLDFYSSTESKDDTGTVSKYNNYSAVTFSGGVKYLINPQFYIGGKLSLIGVSDQEKTTGATVTKFEKVAGSAIALNLGFAF